MSRRAARPGSAAGGEVGRQGRQGRQGRKVRLGVAAIGVSIGCFLVTAVLGPSAHQPELPGSGPPFALDVAPSAYLVTALVVAGILTGAGGLGLCLAAVHRGGRIPARALLVTGLLATAAFAGLPPIGSADHLNYAAYGRMVVTGHDPYRTTAGQLPGDPITDAVQEWRDKPSVYGPIATAQEAFAAWAGDGSVRTTVFVLSVTNALAFALVGVLLYGAARGAGRDAGPDAVGGGDGDGVGDGDGDGDAVHAWRARSVLLWTCNPLLLFHLVSGAHNDTLGIAAAMGATVVFAGGRARAAGRNGCSGGGVLRTFATGALTGAAVAIKLPAGLVGGGPAWVLLRRRPMAAGRLAALFGGAAAVAVGAFTPAGAHAFDQVAKASGSVSFATPWHLVDLATGRDRTVIRIGALILLILLVWLLVRALPRPACEPRPGDVDDALRISTALVLAWLFAAPYALPWYDGLGWAMLALLPWSRFDWLLLARTTALSLAYLPARDPKLIRLPDGLSWLFTVVRPTVIPVTLTGLLAALAVLSLRARPRAPEPAHSQRA